MTISRPTLDPLLPDLFIIGHRHQNKPFYGLCDHLRAIYRVPILICATEPEDSDHVLALTLGADDYVAKTTSPAVLLARINTLLRRTNPQSVLSSDGILRSGDLAVDLNRREVVYRNRQVELTASQFEVLRILAANTGKTVSREEIHRALYHKLSGGVSRSIDICVSHLRRKLGDTPSQAQLLKTVHGVGYLLVNSNSGHRVDKPCASPV